MLTRFQHPGARLPLLTAGYIHDKVEWCRGRVMDAYAVVYLLSGKGSYRDRQHGDVPVAAGDVMVLFPGLEHFYGPHEPGDWAEAYLVFHGQTFVALEREGVLRRERPVLSPGLEPALLGAFDALVRAHSVGPSGDGRRTSAALHSLLVELTLGDEASRREPTDRLLLARTRLEQELEQELDLARLCRELGLGYENFRKQFSHAFGVPPARYRLLRRIDRGKTLLAASDATLSEVASELGFCDEFYFSRQFKKLTGLSPGAYRKGLRGQAP